MVCIRTQMVTALTNIFNRRMGARNSKQRTTPFLVPWHDLTQEWKDVDRVMVECVPRVLATAGYRMYKMKENE